MSTASASFSMIAHGGSKIQRQIFAETRRVFFWRPARLSGIIRATRPPLPSRSRRSCPSWTAAVSSRPEALGATGLAAAPAAEPSAVKDEEKKPKFRLGLVTYNLAANWDLPSLLKACKATGVSPVELRTTHKHGVEPSLSKEERADVKKRFADAGVDIWGCGTVCEFQSKDPAVVQKNIETCKQFVQLAADIGGKGVKVRPNGLPDKDQIPRTLDQIGKALDPLR